MFADFGLTVAREVPLKLAAGVATGAYRVMGGVVRDDLGRIVGHLVGAGPLTALGKLVPGLGMLQQLVEQGQLISIGRDVKQIQETLATVLDLSTASVALSGLGTVTSIAGFAYLSHRLSQVDDKLLAIERDVKDIKGWLTGLQRAELQYAIDNLRHAEAAGDQIRQGLLIQAKQAFNTLAHHYREQWAACRTTAEIAAVDDLYTVAMLGHATVCSNLGLGAAAASDLRDNSAAWARQARAHARAMLFEGQPERLLAAEFVQPLPARTLVELLDFAHDSRRGIDWIDELRAVRARKPTVLDGLANLPAAMKPRAAAASSRSGWPSNSMA
ncbi:MAG: hypothetical protein EON95_20540, partial [Caulobacteraceae bacterium]